MSGLRRRAIMGQTNLKFYQYSYKDGLPASPFYLYNIDSSNVEITSNSLHLYNPRKNWSSAYLAIDVSADKYWSVEMVLEPPLYFPGGYEANLFVPYKNGVVRVLLQANSIRYVYGVVDTYFAAASYKKDKSLKIKIETHENHIDVFADDILILTRNDYSERLAFTNARIDTASSSGNSNVYINSFTIRELKQ